MSELQKYLDENLDSISFKENKNNTSLLAELGTQIKKLRQANGLSQKELASLCKIDQGNLSRIEKGQMNLTISQLQKITDALQMKIKITME